MKKEIGVEKAGRLLGYYHQIGSYESAVKLLQQQRMALIEKLYDACAMLEIPVDKLTVKLVEGIVEWPDPKEEDKKEK